MEANGHFFAFKAAFTDLMNLINLRGLQDFQLRFTKGKLKLVVILCLSKLNGMEGKALNSIKKMIYQFDQFM